jgi:hypothetical protein
VTTDVGIHRIGGPEAKDPFFILATQGVEPEVALSRYTLSRHTERWSIETLFGLLVVSAQKWALSTGKTVIETTVRQCSRETAFLKRQRE